MKNLVMAGTVGLGLLLSLNLFAGKEAVVPPGKLPVIQEVDVLVVGGSSGGVAAAVEAAKKGKVFLVAPRPYLGEDICATYRLWLEPGEKPTTELARQIYEPGPKTVPVGNSLPFTYKADKPSAAQHRDTRPESLLSDGKWQSAANQSVQFNEDVFVVVDLGEAKPVKNVAVMVYQRADDFEVQQVNVETSTDQQQWSQLTVLKNDQLGSGAENSALILKAPVESKTRYLKFAFQKTAESKRILLGEIVVEGASDKAALSETATMAKAPELVTPMQVKHVLDQALIRAGVPFLFASYPTEILRDAKGRPAGVVIANRSGRQAVLAKMIIDATQDGTVARLAGANFTPYPPETQYFNRVVVGGDKRTAENISLRERANPLKIVDRKGESYPVWEYKVQMPMKDGSFGAFAEAEQLARDWTWTEKAVDGSETLFQAPAEHLVNPKEKIETWPGAETISLACFQTPEAQNIFVLGGGAGLSPQAAGELVRPVNLMKVGERIGQAAANAAAAEPKLASVRLVGRVLNPSPENVGRVANPSYEPGEVRDIRQEANPRTAASTVPAETHGMPVLGEYDVVVVGGGTGGAPAGIGAGRHGAKTLLIEYLHGLGGVGTVGLISSYYHGNRVGFTKEVDQGVAAFGGPNTRTQGGWNPETKIEWYRQALRKAGVEIWYGALGTGALVEKGRVKGILVSTPKGPGVILAKVVIDSTGNADIAAAAGAACRYIDETDVAVQGTGLPPRELGSRYTNTDYTFVDETDVFDIWRALVIGREKFKAAYDLGQLIDTRERRQIVGDFTLSPMDMILGRKHPDTIVIAESNFDTHGFIVHPMFMIRAPHRDDVAVRVPYRCLLPKGLDGILVTGLGVSAHRDALPVIRMQADVQNQGYAAGTAAAMIAKKGCTTRELDIKALQQHLVQKGNLPESVLTETDSFPLPKEKVAEAVSSLPKEYQGLEIVLAQFEQAQPLVRQAFASAASTKDKLVFAHVLGMMGDATGVDALLKEVADAKWDKGWRYTGMGQYGPCMSPLDSLLIALGRTKDKRALAPILEKVTQLAPDAEFSHFRAVAMALEVLADKSAAKPLADLLQKAGMGGHAVTNIATALKTTLPSPTDTTVRNQELSELVLARALYRCGDYQGLGQKILRQYAEDLHGHYARHAQAILNEGQKRGNKT